MPFKCHLNLWTLDEIEANRVSNPQCVASRLKTEPPECRDWLVKDGAGKVFNPPTLQCDTCGFQHTEIGIFTFAQSLGDTCRQHGCFGNMVRALPAQYQTPPVS